jgi:hypothetical protein
MALLYFGHGREEGEGAILPLSPSLPSILIKSPPYMSLLMKSPPLLFIK